MASASLLVLCLGLAGEARVAERLEPGGAARVGLHLLQRLDQGAEDHRGGLVGHARL